MNVNGAFATFVCAMFAHASIASAAPASTPVELRPRTAAAKSATADDLAPGVKIPNDASPKATYVDKGQRAPFAGVLLNSAAMATIIAEKKLRDERCKIEVDRAVELARAELQLKLDEANIALEASKKRLALERDMTKKRVDALSNELERAQKHAQRGKWNGAWFAGGVLAGVLVIIAGAFAVRGVRETNLSN